MLLTKFKEDDSLSDLFGSLTFNEVVGLCRHEIPYLMKPFARLNEIFADLFDIYSRRDKTAWNVVRDELPEIAAEFEKMIDSL